MRTVYIILVHDQPEQAFRLMKRLSTPDSTLVIHADKKMSKIEYQKLVHLSGGIERVFFVDKRVRVYWGTMRVVLATMRAISYIMDHNIKFDYAVLLSGSHYPIQSNQHISSFLDTHKGALFLQYTDIPSSTQWTHLQGGLDRLKRWSYVRGRRYHALSDIIKSHLSPSYVIPSRYSVCGLKPYGGSQWWIFPEEVVVYLYKYVTATPSVVRFFRSVDVPDELFFHTILLNSTYKDRIVNNNLNYYMWPGKTSGHPKILDINDFEELKSSEALFARKMSMTQSSSLCEQIDRELLHYCHEK